MPGPRDFAVGTVSGQPDMPGHIPGAVYAGGLPGPAERKKPCYLVKLEAPTDDAHFFVAIDKPDLLNGFIQVKGIFCDGSMSEQEIISNFNDLVRVVPKEAVVEMMFPAHKVVSIRSLVFNANKPTTVGR